MNIKKVVKNIAKASICLVCVCAVCLLVLYLSYLIPTDAIKENIRNSTSVIAAEGSSPQVFRILIPSRLDNFTDTIMMFKTGYTTKTNVFQTMMLVSSERFFDNPYINFLNFYRDNLPLNEIGEYARYWHGYLIFTKPLFYFLNYQNIRLILGILQCLLISSIVIALIKKNRKKIITPVILLYLFLNPIALSKSFQFSNVFFVSFLSFLFCIIYEEKLNKQKYLSLFFVIVGAMTSFFDLLTYPLLSFGLPMVYLFEFNKKSFKEDLLMIAKCMFYWFFGYIGLWAIKWILATLTTNLNVIEAAVEKIKTRTGGEVYSDWSLPINMWSLPLPLLAIIDNLYLIKFHIFLMFCFAIKYLKDYKYKKDDLIYFIFMILPIVWWVFAANHSFIHSYFTHKVFGISYFAYCVFIINRIIEKFNKYQKL